MIETLPVSVDSVPAQQRQSRSLARFGYVAVVGLGCLLGLASYTRFPGPAMLAFAALLCGIGAIVLRPISGVYLIAFFTLFGDGSTMDSYPFALNFSSGQSILYLNDHLTFSPLEVCLAVTFLSWFAHLAGARSYRLLGRPLLRPLLVLGGFVVVGLIYGVGLRGGDQTAAFWEFRPLVYVIAIYVLAANLFTRRAHYVRLAWVVVAAITLQSLWALHFYADLTPSERLDLEALTDHPASVMYAWVLLMAVCLWVFRGCSARARALVTIAAIPTTIVMVLSQRRAAVVGLVAGFVVFAMVLFFRRRKAFLVMVPLVVVFTLGYTAAFWNTTDGVGFGAQAIKSVVAADSVSSKDASSDLYRKIENFDLSYTIRAEPLTGVGFGKPFYRPANLPNISFFIFYQYIPHNSILWIWLKLGYFGFVAMLFGIAVTLRSGVRASLRLPSGNVLAVTVAALLFVVMFVVFAFVDIAWTPQACVFLALCMATCVNMVRVSQGESDQGDDRGTRDKGSRPARRPVPSSPRPPVDIHVPDAREAPEREALREGALESISFVS